MDRRTHAIAARRFRHWGSNGQSIPSAIWHQSFAVMGDADSTDPLGWDNTYSTDLILDWYAGDGLTSRVGPDMQTLVGAPTSSSPTPWVLSQGTSVVCYGFDGGDSLVTSSALSWAGSTADCVLCCLFKATSFSDAGYVMNSRTSGNGVGLNKVGNGGIRGYVNADTTILPGTVGLCKACDWGLAALVIEKTGTTALYVNGVLDGSAIATPSGDPFVNAMGVAAEADGGQPVACSVVRVQVYHGAGIAADWTVPYIEKHAAKVLGVYPSTGGTVPAYRRTGPAMFYSPAGPWLISSNAASLSGRGLQDGIGRTNLCYRNYALSSGNDSLLNVEPTGGAATLTTVDDQAALSSAGLHGFGYRVFQVVNSSGSEAFVTYGDASGNTNEFMASVRARYVAGSAATVGDYHNPTHHDFAAVLDDYAFSGGVSSATNNTCQWSLNVPDGCTLNFLLANFVETDHLVGEIASLSTASPATTSTGVLTLPHGVVLTDTEGAVEVSVEPIRWSGGDDATTRKIITHRSTAASYLDIDDASTAVEIADGTNIASDAISEAFGTPVDLRTSWGSGQIGAVAVGGSMELTAYDGGFGGGENSVSSAWNFPALTEQKAGASSATVAGTPASTATGGGYFEFADDATDYVDVPGTYHPTATSGAFEFIVLAESNAGTGRFFSTQEASAHETRSWSDADGRLRIYVTNSTGTANVLEGSAFSYDVLHQVVWQWNYSAPNTTFELFVDGALSGSSALAGLITVPTDPMQLGKWNAQTFDGRLYALATHSTTRTAAEWLRRWQEWQRNPSHGLAFKAPITITGTDRLLSNLKLYNKRKARSI